MLESSKAFFNQKPMFCGVGGGIPLVGRISKIYPDAIIFLCGVLGPNANAHGPNEMFNIAYAKKLVCCLTKIISDTYKNY